jgi:hypothetical protein
MVFWRVSVLLPDPQNNLHQALTEYPRVFRLYAREERCMGKGAGR